MSHQVRCCTNTTKFIGDSPIIYDMIGIICVVRVSDGKSVEASGWNDMWLYSMFDHHLLTSNYHKLQPKNSQDSVNKFLYTILSAVRSTCLENHPQQSSAYIYISLRIHGAGIFTYIGIILNYINGVNGLVNIPAPWILWVYVYIYYTIIYAHSFVKNILFNFVMHERRGEGRQWRGRSLAAAGSPVGGQRPILA